TGESFPLDRAIDVAPGRLLLAGGLLPETVAAAVRRVRPYAVDVASGVERSPGVKDQAKVEELIRNAKAA
ncbi:MAG: phosphoribosylanthranilate isomerase, partial [Candidatus Binatia bacterium]